MSFLRLLSPSRQPTVLREEPSLTLRVDDYGLVYLTRVAEPFGPTDLEPGYTAEPFSIRGHLLINIPSGHGRCKCKSIRVTLRTICRLAMGPERGWEEDVIWEKTEEAADIWLEEGSTKFEFAFALPHGFPAMDIHDNAIVRQEVYAVVDGLPSQSKNRYLPSFRSASPIASSSRGHSPSSDRRQSPRPSRSPSPSIGCLSWKPDTTSIAFDDGREFPRAPTYEEASGEMDGEIRWLEGRYTAQRNVWVHWNPSPTGGINSLDEKVRDTSRDLGNYEVAFQAPLWSTSCILHTRIHFPNLPSSATILQTRVELVQTVIVRSPREKGSHKEAKAIRTTRRMLICKEGKRPPKDIQRPEIGKQLDVDAGAAGQFRLAMRGRLPNDNMARPSTLHGIETPVHVSHQLLVEVVYSIWNQDRHGNPLDKPGPGDQRVLSIARSVILPGCTLIPNRVNLPRYAPVSTARLAQPDKPCPLCRMVPEDRFCTTCKYERPIHPRHDHPPKLVGNADGICPVCSELVEREQRWHNCACAMSLEDLKKLAKCIKEAGGVHVVQQWGGGEEEENTDPGAKFGDLHRG